MREKKTNEEHQVESLVADDKLALERFLAVERVAVGFCLGIVDVVEVRCSNNLAQGYI